MIAIDSHFHPNFPLFSSFLTKRKANAIWKAFQKHGLSLVLVTEHAYKNPQKSYIELLRHRPDNHQTFLVPGIECLTSEGIDMIAFSRKPDEIFSHKKLMTPYGLSITGMVDYIASHDDLYGIVVHPHTPGTTSIARIGGIDVTLNAIKTLGFLEKHNCSMNVLKHVMKKTGLFRVFKKKFSQISETAIAPEYLQIEAKIMTCGSDAHAPSDIGDYMGIDVPYKNDYEYLFSMATTLPGAFYPSLTKPLSGPLRNIPAVFGEWLIKNFHLYNAE